MSFRNTITKFVSCTLQTIDLTGMALWDATAGNHVYLKASSGNNKKVMVASTLQKAEAASAMFALAPGESREFDLDTDNVTLYGKADLLSAGEKLVVLISRKS